jgi:selenocysteine-specific elongation factor
MDVVIGTAGHIDHGKTALVKALTGVDTDRLPEEKQRGITIDLGFAELELGDARIGFVDVPGHERFVKNMLAGASGIDLVMLVIAADEGVMPQTREHFEICRLLDTKAGLIVLTKKDLADDEMLDLVKLEVAELVAGSFLENVPIIAVSAKSGEGMDELKTELAQVIKRIPERVDDSIARLPIDRSFTVKGFGAVVTGTLASGEIREGDELELLPDRRAVRVRGIQSHGKSESRARAGQRAAINLGGIDHSEILRGMVLAEKGVLRPTPIFDARVEVIKDAKRSLRSRQRVRVHIGTIEALARVHVLNAIGEIEPGQSDLVQVRLETSVVATFADRFIIRSYSPQTTVGGGKVLDSHATKHRVRELREVKLRLSQLSDPEVSKSEILGVYIDESGSNGLSLINMQARTGWRPSILSAALDAVVSSGIIVKADTVYLSARSFEGLKVKIIETIGAHHKEEPLSKGINRETLRGSRMLQDVFDSVIGRLQAEQKIEVSAESISLASRKQMLTDDEQRVRASLLKVLVDSGLEVPKIDYLISATVSGTKLDIVHAKKILQLLLNSGDAVKISDEFYFAREYIEDLISKIRSQADRTIDVAKFKEIAGVSRKYAIPLLEYFDREQITIRTGDKRIIR